MILEFIPEKIRKIRKEKDLTQSYMAEKLGISVSAYSKRERGQKISVDEFAKILNIFNIEEKN